MKIDVKNFLGILIFLSLSACQAAGPPGYNDTLPEKTLQELYIARQIYDHKDYTEALRHYHQIFRLNKSNQAGEEALYRIAESHFHLGNFYEASIYYIQFLEDFNNSFLLEKVSRRILNENARAWNKEKNEPECLSLYWLGFWEGGKYIPGATRRFAYFFDLTAEDVGEDLLRLFIEKSPGSDMADDARKYFADYYFFQVQDYRLAGLAYNGLVAAYRDSEWVELSRFRVALCHLKSWSGIPYDFKPLNRAFEQFSKYLEIYPTGNWALQAKKYKRHCWEMKAEREFYEAKGFLKTGNSMEAKRSLKRILKNFPGALCSGTVKKLLNELKKRKK